VGCGPESVCSAGQCAETCAAGFSDCGGRCRDLQSDGENCGVCGQACAEDEVCSSGVCTSTCDATLTDCGGSCRDLASDRANCGACGEICDENEVCSLGRCIVECAPGLVDCGGSCRDTQSDRAHCGTCGVACPPGEVCSEGACEFACAEGLSNCGGSCRDLQSDNAYCGTCEESCGPDEVCSGGVCTSDCAAGLSDCGGSCRDLARDQAHCGGCGVVCLSDETCFDGVCRLCELPEHCLQSECPEGGAPVCTMCEFGFEPDGEGGCRDADDCADNPCGSGACFDTGRAEYRCECEPGTLLKGNYYLYYGTASRRVNVLPGVDEWRVCTSPVDCELAVLVPSSYLERDVKAIVESWVDTNSRGPTCIGCDEVCVGDVCQLDVCNDSTCEPICDGRECGDDGCGGHCGLCEDGLVCDRGTCASSCEPECAGRFCGDDGCGGSCGTCGPLFECSGSECVERSLLSAVADQITVNEGESVTVTAAMLLQNDYKDPLGGAVSITSVQNPVGGTVTMSGTDITFRSTGISGQVASFSYTARNDVGKTSSAIVTVNVMLPVIEAIMVDTAADLTRLTSAGYQPPSAATIFNSWYRFSHNATLNFPANAAETTKWNYVAASDTVISTVNSVTYIGFVSAEPLSNYGIEMTLSSSGADNDSISIVIAFATSGTKGQPGYREYTLSAVRTRNGVLIGGVPANWVLVYNFGQSDQAILANGNALMVTNSANWNSAKTRVRIERRGDQITAYAGDWNAATYSLGSKLTLDLGTNPLLNKFQGPKSWGLGALSQINATFTNRVITGGLNASVIHDASVTPGRVFDYNPTTGGWAVRGGATPQSVLGCPRGVKRPIVTWVVPNMPEQNFFMNCNSIVRQ
jgi:hypothetical protein